ncbi:MAG: hypothetical protein COV52_01145 [Gammaproteobacteria bacterium CG11_big_fil_rev_8_21_14_0_20_46_22]|nr:MAG: hypothetical protein COW05_03435 [Gammaproteobacteria bacterium CG12_big_fil_rev_8_21_14_0_65_46_12]PIR12024.1 MAG: hypothetical protein COV52_01145 [Gammaproteobacteria bacterium CG11_big_fil_rev_8_21_14_0_20_46_22]
MISRYNCAFDFWRAVVDIQTFCQSQSVLKKSFSINELERVFEGADLADASLYGASVVLEGRVDPDGRRIIKGHVEACVPQVCQRCMQTFAYTLSSDICLSPVSSDEQAKALPTSIEPWYCELSDALDLRQIVEDEVILALPLSARHEENDCPVTAREWRFGEQAPAKENPFASLAKLTRKQ